MLAYVHTRQIASWHYLDVYVCSCVVSIPTGVLSKYHLVDWLLQNEWASMHVSRLFGCRLVCLHACNSNAIFLIVIYLPTHGNPLVASVGSYHWFIIFSSIYQLFFNLSSFLQFQFVLGHSNLIDVSELTYPSVRGVIRKQLTALHGSRLPTWRAHMIGLRERIRASSPQFLSYTRAVQRLTFWRPWQDFQN